MAQHPRKRRAPITKGHSPNPFHRAPKLPERMQGSADLWLELFMGFASTIINDDGNQTTRLAKLDDCYALADKALVLFESRWPGAEL